ncbi:helix-turn-helix domain-containing protein [Mycobacteroides chelonae]|uniref:helix-turn-helix domain-containing protein n=1 Tax=Mycobacteroides chelonae TaxID=1774 RepID=UPI0018B0D410|nr:helix-turn-helix domain-containing protein [Mycobacteroides chelonae]MBF9519566.1 helix-turn-helix domain-containing protein [Mycobacteroides chelonae]
MTEPDPIAVAVIALIAALQAAQPTRVSAVPQIMLTVQEAAEMLGCSSGHIYDQLRNGAIRGVKVGRRRLVPMSEITRITDGG